MKSATLPSLRVEPAFQAEFVARGLQARDEARQSGDHVDADTVVEALQRKLDAAQARLGRRGT